jgi:hypothetical protein
VNADLAPGPNPRIAPSTIVQLAASCSHPAQVSPSKMRTHFGHGGSAGRPEGAGCGPVGRLASVVNVARTTDETMRMSID